MGLMAGQAESLVMTFAHLEALLLRRRTRVSGSVSKKTTGLVFGAEAGSKLEKAEKLGVDRMDEAQFLAFLSAYN